MRPTALCFALVASAMLCLAARAEELSAIGGSGARLHIEAEFPAGDGPHPALVLAPGQGYHLALPAMASTARALVAQGIAVFRFDWAYFSAEPRGTPSDDLARELQDLQAVLALARRHPRVAAARLSVGGKSLGSLVAWNAFRADPQLRSVLLLTPLCSRVPEGQTLPRPELVENYPGFEAERRPSLWIAGDRDPRCAPTVLYGFAARSTGAARVALVGGDHGYEDRTLPAAAAEAALKRNLAAVSALAAGFVAETLSAP